MLFYNVSVNIFSVGSLVDSPELCQADMLMSDFGISHVYGILGPTGDHGQNLAPSERQGEQWPIETPVWLEAFYVCHRPGQPSRKVYAFDPTMGKEDHQRSANVHFQAVGIANYKGTKKIGMGNNWDMRRVDRFENLVNQLGLAGQVIDYVKLDVELSEVDFLQDMLLNSPHVLRNIKQIAMEVHDDYFKGDLSPTSRQQVFWPYFMLLKCQDFRLVHSRSNHGRWREVEEVSWRFIRWAWEANWYPPSSSGRWCGPGRSTGSPLPPWEVVLAREVYW
ncbi:uncharacterized protein [Procambarus clarkii]|uniref:uncharacterized protein isoform X3 n=1 Tax=Procambarus clarkii TaxID=6728 RepID=UPI0037434524